MFEITRGQLILNHPKNKFLIDKIIQTEGTNVNEYKIVKLVWFLDNYDDIINPVTTLTWGDTTLCIHPGHIRLIAARLLQKETIDSIILYSVDSYLEEIAVDCTTFEDNYLYKQPLSNYWQISTQQQNDYLDPYKNKSQVYWDHWNKHYHPVYGKAKQLLKQIKNKDNLFEEIYNLTVNRMVL